jgi:perosamine synthetase
MRAKSTKFLYTLTSHAHVTLTGRAATAIYASLRALDLRDEWVLIPANTCYIVLWAVLKSGNKPYLIDVDPATANISLETLSAFSVGKPAVIIPCHMYGLGAPIKAICEWAREHGTFVIEDATLALGTHVDGQSAGSWGDASVFSFGHGKIVDVELGGVLMTDDTTLADEVEKVLASVPLWDDGRANLTDQWNQIYWALHQHEDDNPRLLDLYPSLFDIYGDLTCYQLPDSYWAELPDKLAGLPANLQYRAEMTALYDEQLANLPVRTLPRPHGSILWKYPLLAPAEQRNDLLRQLWAHGVHDATRWYPPIRNMTFALRPDLAPRATPGADKSGAEIINLRVDEGVTREDVLRIADLIRRYLGDSTATQHR